MQATASCPATQQATTWGAMSGITTASKLVLMELMLTRRAGLPLGVLQGKNVVAHILR